MKSKNLLFSCVLTLFPFLLSAQIYVDHQATGTSDGSSWQNAYTDLQDAIQNSSSGDEIWITAGTYFPSPTGNRTIAFVITHSLSLYGGFSGTESDPAERDPAGDPTILSGDYDDDDKVLVEFDPFSFSIENNSDNAARIIDAQNVSGSITLDGLTIEGGNNTGTGAGALFSPAGELDVVLRNCNFNENFSGSTGAAIRLGGSTSEVLTVLLEHVTARFNKAVGGGSKGAVLWATGNGTINTDYYNCLFVQNQCDSRGGTVVNDLLVNARYFNCIFSTNTAISGGATFENSSGMALYYNCVFYKNHGINEASVIHNFSDFGSVDVRLYNCVFFENGPEPLRGQFGNDYLIGGSIIEYDDFADVLTEIPGSTDLGNNQYRVDPQFIDAVQEDFNLEATSPAVNEGMNSLVVADTDFTGKIDRIVDGTVDIGALEYHLPLTVEVEARFCFGDPAGSAEVIADNYPPFSYEWSDNSVQGANPDNLAAGSYEVTVTNDIGDEAVAGFTLTQNPEILADFDRTIPTGSNIDGSITANASGGTPPYTYEWNTDPVQTGATISNLDKGTYHITITDAVGCQLITHVILAPLSVQAIDETAEIQVGPNPFSKDVQITLSGNLLQNHELNQVLLYDASGKLLDRRAFPQGNKQVTVDWSDLPAGLYLLELRGANKRFGQRLVKME